MTARNKIRGRKGVLTISQVSVLKNERMVQQLVGGPSVYWVLQNSHGTVTAS
jgi:hypothetical protein